MSSKNPLLTEGGAFNRFTRFSVAASIAASCLTVLPAVFNADSPAVAVEPGTSLTVEINDLSPRVLTKQEKLLIKGKLTSKTNTETLSLTVRMRANTPLDNKFLTDYLAGDYFGGQWVITKQLTNIKANTPTDFTIEVPTSTLPLGDSIEWGPRGIEVIAETAETFASDRSILLWDSGIELEPTRIQAVLPFPALVKFKNYTPVLESADPKTLQAISQAASLPGVSLAVPVSLLNTPNTQPILNSAASEILAVPDGFPDFSALENFKQPWEPALTQLTNLRTLNTVPTPGKTLRIRSDVLIFPTQITAEMLSKSAGYTVVSKPLEIAEAEKYNYQPATLSAFTAEGKLTDVKNSDSGVLVSTHPVFNEVLAAEETNSAQVLDNTQLLRAVSAMITRERPFDSRSFAAFIPAGLFRETQSEKLQALLQNRWVKTEKQFYTPADLTPYPAVRELPEHLNTAEYTKIASSVEKLQEAFNLARPAATALAKTPQLNADYNHSVTFLSGFYQQQNLPAPVQTQLVEGFVKRAHTLASAVSVAKPATINLLDKSANLPLRIVNDGSSSATVVVQLIPSDPRLQVNKKITLVIPAQATQQIEFPVKAIGSGDVVVQAQVLNLEGEVIDKRTRFKVRVRADWESTGTFIITVALGLLVAVGVVRTVKKGRRMRPTTD